MRIIPVLDLKEGRVVRGVAGRRAEYRPIESRLCASSNAGDVARALAASFGFDACYVADLDSIAGGAPNWALYDAVIDAGFQPWIDAGTGTPESVVGVADYFLRRKIAGRVVVGLESLGDGRALDTIVRASGSEQIVFSLDLKEGLPMAAHARWRSSKPAEIADEAVRLGAASLIVLDLAGVGVGQGVPTLELCRTLRAVHPALEIVTGGGVRGVDDLEAIRQAGCDGALVASALHDGRISPEDLAKWRG